MPRSFFIPPENIRKPLIFCCFRGYIKRPVAWNGLSAEEYKAFLLYKSGIFVYFLHFYFYWNALYNWHTIFRQIYFFTSFVTLIKTFLHFITFFKRLYTLNNNLFVPNCSRGSFCNFWAKFPTNVPRKHFITAPSPPLPPPLYN